MFKEGDKVRLKGFEDAESSQFDKELIGGIYHINSIDFKLYYPIELKINELYTLYVKKSEIELIEDV